MRGLEHQKSKHHQPTIHHQAAFRLDLSQTPTHLRRSLLDLNPTQAHPSQSLAHQTTRQIRLWSLSLCSPTQDL